MVQGYPSASARQAAAARYAWMRELVRCVRVNVKAVYNQAIGTELLKECLQVRRVLFWKYWLPVYHPDKQTKKAGPSAWYPSVAEKAYKGIRTGHIV